MNPFGHELVGPAHRTVLTLNCRNPADSASHRHKQYHLHTNQIRRTRIHSIAILTIMYCMSIISPQHTHTHLQPDRRAHSARLSCVTALPHNPASVKCSQHNTLLVEIREWTHLQNCALKNPASAPDCRKTQLSGSNPGAIKIKSLMG